MNKTVRNVVSLILIIVAAAVIAVFDIVNVSMSADETVNRLLCATVPRLIAGALLLGVMVLLECKNGLKPGFKELPKNLLWCVPCLLVVLANFPFTALCFGNAKIIHGGAYIALFALECLSIGFMEEILFRGIVQDTVRQLFEKKPYGKLITVAVTSALFGLVHLFNLFAGANAGATLLQVGYSFLIGAMLSAVLFKTDNIWLCILLHAAFDFGGNIITELGTGPFQDLWFWIFTAVAGAACTGHVLAYLIKQK